MSTSPPASELFLDRAIPHAPCPSSSSFYYHDVELLQLEQERKPARMSVKTYLLLFHTLAIDRLSHVSQERADYLPVLAGRCSATKTLTHDSATAPGLSEVQTQRKLFHYGGRSRNKMALRFAYGQFLLVRELRLHLFVEGRQRVSLSLQFRFAYVERFQLFGGGLKVVRVRRVGQKDF